jgi:hypothetical protein
MEKVTIKARFKALSPICQVTEKGESSENKTISKGNVSLCRKTPLLYLDPETGNRCLAKVPTISAMTIRSLLRTAIAKDITDRFPAGFFDYVTINALYGGGAGIPKKRKIASNGNGDGNEEATAKGSKKADLSDTQKRMVYGNLQQTNIVLSLLGSSVYDVILPGKVSASDLIPVCFETIAAGILTANDNDPVFSSYREVRAKDLFEEYQNVRCDRMKDPQVQGLLNQKGVEMLVAADEDARNKNGQHRQQIFRTEAITAGTELRGEISIYNPTEAEVGAIISAFRRFAKKPHIGGKVSIGMGRVDAEFTVYGVDGKEETPIGSFEIIDGKFSNDESLSKFVDAYLNYLKNITEEEIFVPAPEEVKAKKKKTSEKQTVEVS